MATTLNLFDLIFICATLIFVLIAFLRGFVREVFALINWVISILLCYALAPYATKFVGSYTDNILVANIASSAIVFMLIFIFIALSTNKWAKAIQEKVPSSFDKSFGVLFGVVKTLIVFGIIYSLTVNFYAMLLGSNKSHDKATVKHSVKMPDWLAQAKTLPLTRIFGTMLDPFVKNMIENVGNGFHDVNQKQKIEEKLDDASDVSEEVTDEVTDKINKSDVKKKLGEKYPEKGYSKKEIEKMNRLIEIVE